MEEIFLLHNIIWWLLRPCIKRDYTAQLYTQLCKEKTMRADAGLKSHTKNCSSLSTLKQTASQNESQIFYLVKKFLFSSKSISLCIAKVFKYLCGPLQQRLRLPSSATSSIGKLQLGILWPRALWRKIPMYVASTFSRQK